ncbi:MAG: NAD-dependent epimerase/dehydratase family protein [Anaerolineales bacterium]
MTTTLLTGATGFLGEFVVQQFVAEGVRVRAFVRPTSDVTALLAQGVETCVGDLGDRAALAAALEGADVFVNVASLGFGHASNIVTAAVESGVQRAIFVSTTSVFTRLPAASKPVRVAAERLIRESGLAYTIVRPTMIYGTPRDRNIWRLINFLRRWPIVPIVGTGAARQQPVYVADAAQAIVRALDCEAAIGQTYNVAGAEPITLVEMIDTICTALGRRVRKMAIPLSIAVLGVQLVRLLGISLTTEQAHRIEEEKCVDIRPAQRDLCYTPLSFGQGVAHEIACLSAAGV